MSLPSQYALSSLPLVLSGLCLASLPAAARADGDTLVVTATRQAARAQDTPAAIDAVDIANIRNGQPQINLSESLARVPGLVIANRQNYAQDLQISSRGFGARSTFGIRGIKLIVDDIPATFPDGQGQGAVFPLASLQRIEVLRGPWAVAYGNASGGVINAISEAAGADPGISTSLLVGSDAQRRWGVRMSAAGSVARASVDVNRFTTDGFRAHSRTVREQSYAKATFGVRDNDSLTLLAGTLDQPDTQDPLGLTRAQFDADLRQAGAGALQFNTRKSVQQRQGGAVYETAAGGLEVKLIGYGGTRDIEQFLATPVAAQAAPTSSGGVVDLQREFSGAGLRLSQAKGVLHWVAGVDFDTSTERRQGFENFDSAGTLGVVGRKRRDEENRATSADVFAQGTWHFDTRSRLQVGVRASRIRIRSEDHFIASGNGDDSGWLSYRNTSPAIGFLREYSQVLNLYASASRGFETPTLVELAYRPDGAGGLNTALQPATSRNLELGAKLRVNNTLRMDVALFDITTQREIVPATNAGGRTTFQNAGRTQRRGVEWGMDWRDGGEWSASASATWLDARFRDGFTSTTTAGAATTVRSVSADNLLPGVPRRTAFAEIVWRKSAPGFSVALDAYYRGAVATDDRNTSSAPGYATVNLRLMHRFQTGAFTIDSFVRVDNLADRKYAGSVIVNEANERYFESAPGRSGYAGITVRYTPRF